MNLINLPLQTKQWIATKTEKTHIVWHGSFTRTSKEVVTRWNNMAEKHGTSYIICRDGTIYNTFDDSEWNYHLNIPTSRGQYDKRSIGITLANEQHLIKQNGRYYAFEYNQAANQYLGPVIETSWRGYNYFAKLDKEQVRQAITLTLDICSKHNIRPVFYVGHGFDPKVWERATIFTHAAVKKDVTDLILEPWVIEQIKAAGITVVDS